MDSRKHFVAVGELERGTGRDASWLRLRTSCECMTAVFLPAVSTGGQRMSVIPRHICAKCYTCVPSLILLCADYIPAEARGRGRATRRRTPSQRASSSAYTCSSCCCTRALLSASKPPHSLQFAATRRAQVTTGRSQRAQQVTQDCGAACCIPPLMHRMRSSLLSSAPASCEFPSLVPYYTCKG